MTLSPLTRFTAASGLTNLGDGIATIAWAWVASLLTRDPLLIAAVAVALRLPWAIFALPAGIVADRIDRRRLILRMDLLRAAAFLVAALALWTSQPLPEPATTGLSAPWAYVGLLSAAMMVGVAEVFRDNAAQTILPALVPHDRLEQANGRLWAVEITGNSLLGPASGAILIGVSVALPFAVNAGAYAIAALVVAGIAGQFRPLRSAPSRWRTDLAEAVAFLRGAPLLRLLAWLTGFWNLFWQMVAIALVLHVQENLGLGATAYGLILASGAAGGILGGLAGASIVRRFGPARVMQWSLFASAPLFAAIALVPSGWMLALALAVFEFSGLVWNTVSVSWRQRSIPDHLLGRVNSVYRLLAWGMMPLGLFLSGLIVRGAEMALPRDIALTAPFWAAGTGVALVTLAGWRGLGRGFR